MFGGGFEQFFGGGGPPRGSGGGGGGGPVDNKKFYELLGIEPGASEQEIKKGWRKTAATLHPDRGGDTQKFQEAQRAYEILSDPEKRARYDKFGEAAFSGNDAGGGGGGGDMDDVLRAFFGGGGGGPRGPRGPPRGKDVGMKFEVSLNELYTGAEKKVDWERKQLCKECDGNGGPPEAKTECHTCDGHGIVIKTMRMGPMIQQQQVHCPDCRGQGYSMKESLMCKPCRGKGIIDETVDLHFTISPGMTHGEKIKLAEEGDRVMKEMIPGDVYIVLDQAKHPEFERHGDHLVYKKKISLLEALTGFQFIINHLDGRQLRVSSPQDDIPHKVVKPGDLKLISHEGMPTHRNPLVKGVLAIQFEIEFPESIGAIGTEEFKTLHKFLPLGDNMHSKYKDYISEEEQKKLPAANAPSTGGGKKKRNRKKKAAAAATNATQSSSETGEDDVDMGVDEPVDVLLEEISKEAFTNMQRQSSQGRRAQHAHDEDDEDGPGGGTQCRVN
jgi:DnaJ family protein A protein 2